MAVNGGTTDDTRTLELDQKYNIVRPTCTQTDFEELQNLIINTARSYPKWNKFWLEDTTIQRFLRAYITVAAAHDALIEYCDWRLEHDVDGISPDDPDIRIEESIGRSKICYGTTDSCGRPVMVVYPRYHDKSHGNLSRLYKYAIFIFEQMSGLADKSGDGTFCLIFNLKGFSYANMDYQGVKQMLWILKNCYPERLGVALVYNYPWIFYGFWEVVKHWINSITRSKVLFCGDNELNDFVDVELVKIEGSVT